MDSSDESIVDRDKLTAMMAETQTALADLYSISDEELWAILDSNVRKHPSLDRRYTVEHDAGRDALSSVGVAEYIAKHITGGLAEGITLRPTGKELNRLVTDVLADHPGDYDSKLPEQMAATTRLHFVDGDWTGRYIVGQSEIPLTQQEYIDRVAELYTQHDPDDSLVVALASTGLPTDLFDPEPRPVDESPALPDYDPSLPNQGSGLILSESHTPGSFVFNLSEQDIEEIDLEKIEDLPEDQYTMEHTNQPGAQPPVEESSPVLRVEENAFSPVGDRFDPSKSPIPPKDVGVSYDSLAEAAEAMQMFRETGKSPLPVLEEKVETQVAADPAVTGNDLTYDAEASPMHTAEDSISLTTPQLDLEAELDSSHEDYYNLIDRAFDRKSDAPPIPEVEPRLYFTRNGDTLTTVDGVTDPSSIELEALVAEPEGTYFFAEDGVAYFNDHDGSAIEIATYLVRKVSGTGDTLVTERPVFNASVVRCLEALAAGDKPVYDEAKVPLVAGQDEATTVYKFESSASGAPPSDVEAVLDDQPTSHEASAERDLLARVRALGGRLGGGEKSDVAEPASGGRFAGMKALYNRLRGGDKPASSKDTTEALDSQVTTVHAGSVKRDEREAIDGFFDKEAPSLATPPPVRGKPPRKPDAKTVSIEKYPAQNNDRLTGPIIGVLTLGLVGSIAWYGLKDSRLRDVKSTKDNAVAKPDLAPHRVTVGVPDAMSTPVDARVQDAYVKDATVTKDYAIAKPDAKVKDAYVKDAHVPDVKIKDGSPVYVALHGAIKSKNRDDIAAVIRKHCGETLDILSADYNGKTPRAAMGELFDDLTYADTKLSGRNDLRRNFVDVMGNVTLPYSLTCD